jgi:hypothetical protein
MALRTVTGRVASDGEACENGDGGSVSTASVRTSDGVPGGMSGVHTNGSARTSMPIRKDIGGRSEASRVPTASEPAETKALLETARTPKGSRCGRCVP